MPETSLTMSRRGGPLVAVTFSRATVIATAFVIEGLAGIAATSSERRTAVVAIARQCEAMFIARI